MATGLPPPPINDQPGSFTWLEWYRKLRDYIGTNGSVPWYVINFAGSNITDIATRDHDQLQNLDGGTAGEHYHLTAAQYAALTAGPHNNLSGLQGGTTSEYYHLTAAEYSAIATGPTPYIATATGPTQTVPQNTSTQMNLTTLDLDPDGSSISNGYIGVPVTGYYQVTCTITYANAITATFVQAQITKNGGDIIRSAGSSSTGGTPIIIVTGLFYAVGGDYFTPYTQHNASGSISGVSARLEVALIRAV